MKAEERSKVKTLYFEDFKVGDRFESPGTTVTEGQIIEFAMQYDPQPFHLNVEAAKSSIYGGLIASGIHTMALMFRLFLMTGAISESNLGAPGIDDLRWPKPLRPADTLRALGEVLELIPSRSKPDRGIIRFRISAVNQRNETVLTLISNHLIAKRLKIS